jgi:hypothetical protein
MIKAFSLICCGIFLLPIATWAGYDDWKAPPPVAQLKDMPLLPQHKEQNLLPHHLFVNEVVEAENLPFISIKGYNLKIAINPQVLKKYGLKSGDLVTSDQMYEIIDADRDFQRGVLK